MIIVRLHETSGHCAIFCPPRFSPSLFTKDESVSVHSGRLIVLVLRETRLGLDALLHVIYPFPAVWHTVTLYLYVEEGARLPFE